MDSKLHHMFKVLLEKAIDFWETIFGVSESSIYCFRLLRVVYLLTPIVGVLVVYNSLKYLLIHNAQQYEEFVKRKHERIKKVNKRLKFLAKHYGNLYFCYMPINHGTMLPRTYSLFLAIRDVLTNTERPGRIVLCVLYDMGAATGWATAKLTQYYSCSKNKMRYFPASRVLRMNLLKDLLQANQSSTSGFMRPIEISERGYFDDFPHDVDPLSEFNLDIMKCSRELIIQGVKDFDTMSTVYRVLETVVEDSY